MVEIRSLAAAPDGPETRHPRSPDQLPQNLARAEGADAASQV